MRRRSFLLGMAAATLVAALRPEEIPAPKDQKYLFDLVEKKRRLAAKIVYDAESALYKDLYEKAIMEQVFTQSPTVLALRGATFHGVPIAWDNPNATWVPL